MARTEFSKTCAFCGVEFATRNRPQRFCSHRCKASKGTQAERFAMKFVKAAPDDCWFWTAGGAKGYGVFDKMPAHRMAWILAYGPIPDGKWVLHNCDARYPAGDPTNRGCVNPAHLRLGTRAENTADMVARGRAFRAKGALNSNARITDEIALRIRAASGTPTQIAAAENISASIVRKVLKRESWRHL